MQAGRRRGCRRLVWCAQEASRALIVCARESKTARPFFLVPAGAHQVPLLALASVQPLRPSGPGSHGSIAIELQYLVL